MASCTFMAIAKLHDADYGDVLLVAEMHRRKPMTPEALRLSLAAAERLSQHTVNEIAAALERNTRADTQS
jgi:hypothetical protein